MAEWRNWRLPVKVGAILAVPVIAAVTLGVTQIHNDISQAGSLADTQRLIGLRDALIPLADDLQTERWQSAEKLGTTDPVSVPAYHQLTARVDRDVVAVTAAGRGLLDPTSAAGIRYEGLVGQLAGLPTLHQQALIPSADVVTVVSNYGQVISAVLNLEEAITPQLGDPRLTSLALSLNDLEVAQEQIRQQQAIVTVAIFRGSLLDTELQTLQSSDVLLQDRLNNFQVGATPAQLAVFQRPGITNDLNNREQLAQQVLSNGLTLMVVGSTGQGTSSLGVSASSWITASDAAAAQVSGVGTGFSESLTSTVNTLERQASDAAGVESLVLLGILLLALLVGVIIGRHLLGSLNILRRTALEVAEYRLPEVVASIDDGNFTDLSIEPVPVHTHEELGQLARAFDAVHGQAVRSAVGQATLRSNLRNIFVNLSRRSQGLVERQLRLMERLERNEEDPQQLANLFKLDHLATRMRRNNENLMVLSGDDQARRTGGPLPLADVVRAAVSEIEHYQRVVVRSTPSVDVLGYAAGDLTRLIAELLDNAASFSPPQAPVLIGGRSTPTGSILIEIRDEGIGMAAAELAEANDRLASTAGADVPVSRQMGLYVVGRLARRHAIQVSLTVPAEGGLLVLVQVPVELVRAGTGPMRPNTPFTADATPTPGLGFTFGPLNGTFTDVATEQATNGRDTNGSTSNGGSADLFSVSARIEPTPETDRTAEWTAFSGSAIRDNGSTNGTATNDGTTNGGPSNSGMINGVPSNGGQSNGPMTHGSASNGFAVRGAGSRPNQVKSVGARLGRDPAPRPTSPGSSRTARRSVAPDRSATTSRRATCRRPRRRSVPPRPVPRHLVSWHPVRTRPVPSYPVPTRPAPPHPVLSRPVPSPRPVRPNPVRCRSARCRSVRCRRLFAPLRRVRSGRPVSSRR